MGVVAITALDIAVIPAIGRSQEGSLFSDTDRMLLLGALPMANVLAMGLLAGMHRLGSRSFLLGFEAFGVISLAFYICMATLYAEPVLRNYIAPPVDHIVGTIGPGRPVRSFLAVYSAAIAMLVLPQLVVALFGGLLARPLNLTMTHR